MFTINVIGLGYIGLPTALMLSASGHKVIGSDSNRELVSKLRSGELTFDESGLNQLLERAVGNGILFSRSYEQADVYIIAVPTPFERKTRRLDPHYVVSAVGSVLEVCPRGSIIVIESTVSPGSIDRYVRPEISKRGLVCGQDIHLVHAPERIIPGNMLYELENNARTVGADCAEIGMRVRDLYSSFCRGEIVLTDIRSAEMSKVVENTYRDINIAFANELAKICRTDNMNVYEIIRIANMHPRVNILQPGPGVGGHCISVDPWFLVGDYPDLTNLILAARRVNDSMPSHVLHRIREIMDKHRTRDVSRVGLYGLTYKENVDDTRESPTLQLLERMAEHLAFGAKVYDPYVKESIVDHQYSSFDEFLNDVDILVIMVGHDHIRENMDRLAGKIVLDTRNVCRLEEVYRI